jgi:hypothetical protein
LQRCTTYWKAPQVQDNIHMWIGRWPVDDRVAVLNGMPDNLTNQAGLLKEALKNMYGPIRAHVYHAHALRIHLLRGRIPTEIKSTYTNPWYDDMPPLPIHPLRRHRLLIDKEWDSCSQESDDSTTTETRPQRVSRGSRKKRNRTVAADSPPAPTVGPHQYPDVTRTPVSQRYHYVETEPPEEKYQLPSRHRIARLTPAQIRQAVSDNNVDLLNEVAAQRKLPGYLHTHIAVDSNGKGLCLRASRYIAASHPQSTRGLCEYTGTERLVPQDEHVNSVPMRQLMYGCEYQRNGRTYRKSPDQDLDSLLRYMQSPNPGEEPTCRLLITKDKPDNTTVSLGINRPLQPLDELTIEYGGPYWQIFWPHLSLEQQRRMRSHYTDTVFPPHWPQEVPRGYHDQRATSQLESDYSLAARNIYDVLRQEEEGDDMYGDEDIWTPNEPSTPPTLQSPAQAAPHLPARAINPPRNESIITMLQPSRHIFRGWQHQTFHIHNEVGIEVAHTIVLKMATAVKQPMPAIPTTKDMRTMMMHLLWRNHTIDEIHEGRCGPSMRKCFTDVITEMGDMNEREMQEQITIRMTKTVQDPPPHYAIKDRALIRLTLAGLIDFVSSDRGDEWSHSIPSNLVIGTKITSEHLTDDCDGAVEINETPPLIILWTRRSLADPTISGEDYRPRPLRRLTSHRENDKPP